MYFINHNLLGPFCQIDISLNKQIYLKKTVKKK